jgi:hypothetical protein
VSNALAIFYFLKCRFQENPNKWYSVRDVASTINLSIDRSRKHLTFLVLQGEIETRVDGWKNVYRCRVRR